MGNQALTRYYDHLSMNTIHQNRALKLHQSFWRLKYEKKCGVEQN